MQQGSCCHAARRAFARQQNGYGETPLALSLSFEREGISYQNLQIRQRGRGP